MVIIRSAQMTALQCAADERFVGLAAPAYLHFREGVGVTADDPALRYQIQQDLMRARAYGFVYDRDLLTFGLLALTWGSSFEEESTVQSILSAPPGRPDMRMDKLLWHLLSRASA